VRVIRAAAIWQSPGRGFLGSRRERSARAHVDEAYCIGRQLHAGYLNIAAIIAAAKKSNAEAIHPGYGFLAENAEFAAAVAVAGLTFIGQLRKRCR